MFKVMYLRLAVTNIKKNRSTYVPYILTCVCCIAMLYVMLFLQDNPGLKNMIGGTDVKMLLSLGIIVIGIFSFIFLLYSNSFLAKRRQKEIGLYNILGMEKGHISKMLLVETFLSFLISIVSGCLLGVLMSKLALLLLLKLIHFPVQFGFYVSVGGLEICAVVFGGIFLLTLLNNLRRVHVSRPIELLHGSSAGEREPKAKWLMALLGAVCLCCGYYIAVTTEDPLSAVTLFLVAVLLVMAGTYLLFTAGSIAVLKMLRWNKKFYYQTRNFTSISGMIYRMKQNAVGLANICILSTGVLLMISTTVCLYFGMHDVIQNRFPHEIDFAWRYITLEEGENAVQTLKGAVEKEQIPVEEMSAEISLEMVCLAEDTKIVFPEASAYGSSSVDYLSVIPVSAFEEIEGEKISLHAGEILAFREKQAAGTAVEISGKEFIVNDWLTQWPLKENPDPYDFMDELWAVVVTDEDFQWIYEQQMQAYGKNASSIMAEVGIDVSGSKEDEVLYGHLLQEYAEKLAADGIISETAWVTTEIREEQYDSFYALYGGLFFIGILLGMLFLMGATMIIYYKQMSEGFEDKERFAIMRKVGMSREEVRASIHRQILMVFFLPLLMAVVHIVMAFPMVRRLLWMLNMDNVRMFAACTAGTILVFALVYGGIYGITAKAYYRILEKAE